MDEGDARTLRPGALLLPGAPLRSRDAEAGVPESLQRRIQIVHLETDMVDPLTPFLEPTGGATPIGRFLEKRGEGIHHVCFEVDDLDAALERFRNAGLNVTGGEGSARQEERAGAEGSRIAFIHPRSTGGVLIELRETGGGKR